MSEKRRDSHGRWRNKMIAFRVSPEEDELIDSVVKMLGVSKQYYLTANMLKHTINITPSPRMFKGLRTTLNDIIEELRRIENGEKVDDDLLLTINTAIDIYRRIMGLDKR